MASYTIRFKGGRGEEWIGLPLSGGNFDTGSSSADKFWMLGLDVPLQIVSAHLLVTRRKQKFRHNV